MRIRKRWGSFVPPPPPLPPATTPEVYHTAVGDLADLSCKGEKKGLQIDLNLPAEEYNECHSNSPVRNQPIEEDRPFNYLQQTIDREMNGSGQSDGTKESCMPSNPRVMEALQGDDGRDTEKQISDLTDRNEKPSGGQTTAVLTLPAPVSRQGNGIPCKKRRSSYKDRIGDEMGIKKQKDLTIKDTGKAAQSNGKEVDINEDEDDCPRRTKIMSTIRGCDAGTKNSSSVHEHAKQCGKELDYEGKQRPKRGRPKKLRD